MMKQLRIIAAALAATFASTGYSICESCNSQPPIRMIDHACLPAGKSPADVPLYRQDIDEQYVQIAHIDSYVCQDPDEGCTKAMLKDLEAKARIAGADAVIRVKMLANKRTGFIENPRTPFISLQQGKWEENFFRGIAIKYTRPPKPAPETVQEPALGPVLIQERLELRDIRGRRVRTYPVNIAPQNNAPVPTFPQVEAPTR